MRKLKFESQKIVWEGNNITWVDENKAELDQLSYGDLTESPEGDLIEVPYTMHSDYSGSTVECANCLYIDENYKELLSVAVWRVYGGYSTEGYVRLIEFHTDNDELQELWDYFLDEIESLDNYPLFNDEYMSELELKIESESWEDYVKFDLTKALIEKGIYTEDNIPEDSALRELFYKNSESANVYFECESHNSGYWDIDRIVENWVEG